MPVKTVQWTIKKVKQSWTSFLGSLRSYKKNPELFNGVPKPPKYKHRNGEFMLIGGKLKHPGWEESKCINCGVIYSRDKLASLSISVRVLYLCGTPFAVSSSAFWHSMKNDFLYHTDHVIIENDQRLQERNA